MMLTSDPAARQDQKRDPKQGRTRALCAAGGVLAAVAVWIIEVPVLGIHLVVRFGGGHVETIGIGQIIGVSLAASLLGWLLLAIAEKRTARARVAWTSSAVLAAVASLALPLGAATTTAASTALIVMHIAVAAAVIPALSRTCR
jgi:hypothetical protein